MQLEKLLKKLRGKDYRAAYGTIPQLRRADDGSLAATVASYKPKDEQRRFQFELAVLCCARESRVWRAAALEEPDDKVRGYALLCAKAAVEGEKMRAWVTPERRARIAQALVRAMARHDEHPRGLFWLEKYVELLGLTGDTSVIERLERLRGVAGASRRTVVEKLDPDNLPYPYPKDPKDWPPGLPKPGYRVSSLGTGLLDIKVLETALTRIRARTP